MRIILILFLLFFQIGFAAQFGEYKYSKYNAINAQLQNRRMQTIRQNARYNQSPTRNIKYPTANNPYPNIQRTPQYNLTPQQRYSAAYYNRL